MDLRLFNNMGESVMYLALEQDRVLIKDIADPAIQQNQKKEIFEEEEIKYETEDHLEQKQRGSTFNPDIEWLFECDHKEKMQAKRNFPQDLLIDVIHFMVHRIEFDPKKGEEPIIVTTKRKDREMRNYPKMSEYIKRVAVKREHTSPSNVEIHKNLIHQLLIDKDPKIVATVIHSRNGRSSLGHILSQSYLKDIRPHFAAIVNQMLDKGAAINQTEVSLLYTLFVDVIVTADQFKNPERELRICVDVFDRIIKNCNISERDICDGKKNTPLHTILLGPPKYVIVCYKRFML